MVRQDITRILYRCTQRDEYDRYANFFSLRVLFFSHQNGLRYHWWRCEWNRPRVRWWQRGDHMRGLAYLSQTVMQHATERVWTTGCGEEKNNRETQIHISMQSLLAKRKQTCTPVWKCLAERIYMAPFQITVAKVTLREEHLIKEKSYIIKKYRHCIGKRRVCCEPLQQHHTNTPHIHTATVGDAR